jgi:hypothetical protein
VEKKQQRAEISQHRISRSSIENKPILEKSKKIKIRNQKIEVNASTEELWGILTDFNNLNKWMFEYISSSITSMELDNIGVGTRYRVKSSDDWSLMEIVHWEEQKRLISQFESDTGPYKTLQLEWNLTPNGNSTSVSGVGRYELGWGIFGFILDPIILRWYISQGISKYISGLKYFAEKGKREIAYQEKMKRRVRYNVGDQSIQLMSQSRKCIECGTDNMHDFLFCEKCGSTLTQDNYKNLDTLPARKVDNLGRTRETGRGKNGKKKEKSDKRDPGIKWKSNISSYLGIPAMILSIILLIIFLDPYLPNGLSFMLLIVPPFLFGVWRLSLASKTKNWPTIEGKITKSYLMVGSRYDEGGNYSGQSYRAVIHFQYNVNDVEYGSDCVKYPLFGTLFRKRSSNIDGDKREIVRKYRIGSIVDVYYNPKRPADSILQPGPPWVFYVFVGIWGFFILLGILSWF